MMLVMMIRMMMIMMIRMMIRMMMVIMMMMMTRSLGALRAPTSRWRPFGPLYFVLRALRALRPCDPRSGDWIVC